MDSLYDDIRLLDDWRERGDRSAMDQLVRRQIHFVYGAARRQMGGDAQLAEDVTQAVFMLLMQKKPHVRSGAALAVWLHRATRYASANARRLRVRQTRRDQAAARLESIESTAVIDEREARERMIPVLDDAIARLPARDRVGVILCFFQQQTYRQIGQALGTSEEAARKRVSRAIEKMRDYFHARGIATSGGAISMCMEAQATMSAPASLVNSTSQLVGVTQLAGVSTSVPAIVKGAMHAMLMTKVKLAAAACAALMLGTVATTAAIQQFAVLPVTATLISAETGGESRFGAAVGNLRVEFLGLARWGAQPGEWFGIDGAKIADPRGPFANREHGAREGTTHQIMLRIVGPAAGGYAVRVDGKQQPLYDLTPSDDEAYLLVPFSAPKEKKSVDVDLLVADGEWKTIGTREHERPGEPLEPLTGEYGGVAFTHISDTDGRATVYVAYEFKPEQGQFDVFAVDAQGNEHRCSDVTGGRLGAFSAFRYVYSIPPDQVTALSVKVRPYGRIVTAKGVTIDPARPSQPQIAVQEIAAKP